MYKSLLAMADTAGATNAAERLQDSLHEEEQMAAWVDENVAEPYCRNGPESVRRRIVGDDQAVEAQALAQQSRDHGARQRGRHRGVDRLEQHMRRHDRLDAGAHGLAEGHQLDLLEPRLATMHRAKEAFDASVACLLRMPIETLKTSNKRRIRRWARYRPSKEASYCWLGVR